MNIKPSDITCTRKDFIRAKNILIESGKTDEISLKRIILTIKYFSKRFSVPLNNFNEMELLDKMKQSNNFYYIGIANRVEEILGYKDDLMKIIDSLRTMNEKLIQEDNIKLGILSTTDSLTGLHNRRAFDKKLKEEFLRSKRSNTSLSLILFDIYHFKKINDIHGYDVGDLILKLVSKELNIITRNIDFKFRIGGEEFAIILTGENFENTIKIAEKIRVFFERLIIEGLPTITMSFGISFFNNQNDNITSEKELFKKADESLYKAKNSGRNCVKTYLDLDE